MKNKITLKKIWKARYLYLLLLPFMVWLIVFCYSPMYGVLLAFKKYNARLGILRSPWVGLKNFERIFITPSSVESIMNTLEISFSRLLFQFAVPIILAIMITEMRGKMVKKVSQTILTFPHFLSWIVVAAIVKNLLSNNGAVNAVLQSYGLERIDFLGIPEFARPLLYLTANWKGAGWGAIIYMATIAGIDPTLYEAASIDGASRIRQIWHITLTGLKPTIVIMFILEVGGMMNAGFDQIFYMRNALTMDQVQILDTYVYDITFNNLMGGTDYGFSTAVGLFKSVINFILLVTANYVVTKINGQGMFK